MSLTFSALCYLSTFDAGKPLPNGMRFEKRLRTYRLDYSIQSLERIDTFLDEVRASGEIRQADYLDDPSAQTLLYFLNFYVGEVIARCLKSPAYWYDFEEVRAIDPLADYTGPAFENSATVGFPAHPISKTKPWFRPFSSITARVFDEYPDKSVLFSAGFLLPQSKLEGPDFHLPQPPFAASAWPGEDTAADENALQARAQVEIRRPQWLPGDKLEYLFDNLPELLRNGRVVWGAVVQANQTLFKRSTNNGAPGEVVYDPLGRIPRGDLVEFAHRIYALKESAPENRDLMPVHEHLTSEMTRAFGMDIATSFIAYPVKLSTTYFDRQHLPHGKLVLSVLPLLLHDGCPSAVIPLPAKFWPSDLLAEWDAAQQASAAIAAAQGDKREAYIPDPALIHLNPMSVTEEGLLWFRQKDYTRARQAWERGAADGNAGAQSGLGRLYEDGLGVT